MEGGLVPGRVTEIGGKKLIELAAVLQKRMHVIYADCANRFDPYEAARHAQDETCLERIHIARPFTVYQLKELVYRKLEPALQHLEMPAMLFAGIDSYRPQGPMDEDEFKAIMERIDTRIRSLTRDYQIICAISYGGMYGKDR